MKLGLLIFLLALGAQNLRLRGRGPFGRLVSAELVLTIAIFVATGFLASLPQPTPSSSRTCRARPETHSNPQLYSEPSLPHMLLLGVLGARGTAGDDDQRVAARSIWGDWFRAERDSLPADRGTPVDGARTVLQHPHILVRGVCTYGVGQSGIGRYSLSLTFVRGGSTGVLLPQNYWRRQEY